MPPIFILSLEALLKNEVPFCPCEKKGSLGRGLASILLWENERGLIWFAFFREGEGGGKGEREREGRGQEIEEGFQKETRKK